MEEKEKLVGNSPLYGKPKSGLSFKIAPGAVHAEHIADNAVTPEKISNEVVGLAGSFFQNLIVLDYDQETGNIWAYYGKEGNIKDIVMDEEGNIDLYSQFQLEDGSTPEWTNLNVVCAGEPQSELDYDVLIPDEEEDVDTN